MATTKSTVRRTSNSKRNIGILSYFISFSLFAFVRSFFRRFGRISMSIYWNLCNHRARLSCVPFSVVRRSTTKPKVNVKCDAKTHQTQRQFRSNQKWNENDKNTIEAPRFYSIIEYLSHARVSHVLLLHLRANTCAKWEAIRPVSRRFSSDFSVPRFRVRAYVTHTHTNAFHHSSSNVPKIENEISRHFEAINETSE